MPSTKITGFDMAEGISVVKSVQRGKITIPKSTTSATATIEAVGDKAVVVLSGYVFGTHQSDSFSGNATAYLEITDSTTVTATRYNTSSDYTLTVAYQVIEFY